MTQTTSESPSGAKPARKKKKYIPAVTPRLRIALFIVFGLFALLAANSVYLFGVTVMQTVDKEHLYQDYFYILMQLVHLLLGFLILVPFIIFISFHFWATRKRKNKTAMRMGYLLVTISLALLISGILLVRIGGFDLRQPLMRKIVYLVHVITPLAAIWLYWLHRLAGPPIKWRVAGVYAAIVALVVGGMFYVKAQDPRDWARKAPEASAEYFFPSKALLQSKDGRFIKEDVLMNEEYCLKCHADIYEDWSHSAHRFSSFNNPWYLTSVMETRRVAMEKDGSVQASRWCAGCHDPVPFFSGKFDDPDYDFVNDKTSQAGITCTVCHSMSYVNSNLGNADYSIEEPIHYPFAYSKNPILQWVNNQLVKAKPEFHKRMMLKDFHKDAEFCSTCHKVHLPKEVTHYKDWLRGQNHYDPYLLSGVSGHGLRSFYYPPTAQTNCNECHMPQKASTDFGAKPMPANGELGVHNHQFPAANTAITWLKKADEATQAHRNFLKDVMRVDIFGIKQGRNIDEELMTAPLRPEVPTLKPGSEYLLETVIRTMKLGHFFTQGTVDSNEVWMDVKVIENAKFDAEGKLLEGQIIGRNGGLNENREVDPWAHFVNVFMLDRNGNRIDRRNAQDIFVPLYNHQIPPGAGQVVHYRLMIPEKVSGPVTVEVKLQYRKFDQRYTNVVAEFHRNKELPFPNLNEEGQYRNDLPITTLAVDRVTFPIAGIDATVEKQESKIEPWQRWNDYGIGLLLEGKAGGERGELKQAAVAFEKVEALGKFHGPLNLARVYNEESQFDDAVDALQRADKFRDDPQYPAWTAAWLNGEVNFQQNNFEEAIDNFRSALEYRTPETIKRKFDFTKDYFVINQLGISYFELAKTERGESRKGARIELLEQASEQFHKALAIDSENAESHYQLSQVYGQLAELAENEQSATEFRALAEKHGKLQFKYKSDESAGAVAIRKARDKYPWGDQSAEAVVLYKLNRAGTYELPAEFFEEDDEGAPNEQAEANASQNTDQEVNK